MRIHALLCVFLFACSSTPKPDAPSPLDAPLTQAIRQELEDYCKKGNPFACFRLGSDADDQKNWGEAKVWFQKACDLRLAAACSEASVMAKSHLNQLAEAFRLAQHACDLNDTLGCYNRACYECLLDKPKESVLKSLNLSIALGYRNWAALEADPDLECFRKSAHWIAFKKQFPIVDTTKGRVAIGTGPRHLYHPRLRFSYAAVPGFSIQYSPGGVLVHDEAGSKIFFTGSHQPYSEAKKALESTELLEGKGEVLTVHETEVNQRKSYAKIVRGSIQGLETIVGVYITGDEAYTATAQVTYLASFHSTYGDAILQSAESIVLDPRGPPSADDLAFIRPHQLGSYRFVGLQFGSPIWKPQGDRKSDDTLILSSFIYTPEDPFQSSTFEKLWKLVSAQSGIRSLSAKMSSIARSRGAHGNQGLVLASKGSQKRLDGTSREVQFELGLVKMPHRAAIGEVGYFWARISKQRTSQTDLTSMLSLQLKPEMIEEFKNTPAEETEIVTPRTNGDGEIPAS